MICQKCGKEFEENDIHESHDVPCYLFIEFLDRKTKKNEADKYGRHYLCNNREEGCHKKYEKALNEFLKKQAIIFSKEYFKEVKKDGRHIH